MRSSSSERVTAGFQVFLAGVNGNPLVRVETYNRMDQFQTILYPPAGQKKIIAENEIEWTFGLVKVQSMFPAHSVCHLVTSHFKFVPDPPKHYFIIIINH